MRINSYLNCFKQDIENKQYNIWIGISLGNKWFTKENIKEYILWSLDHTKEGVLVVIADTLHAINLEVLSTMKKETALAKSIRIGEEKLKELTQIMDELPIELRNRVEIVRWDEVVDSEEYDRNLRSLKEEYATNEEFRSRIIKIVVDGRPDRQSMINRLRPDKLDRLAEYVLTELPVLINGVHSKKTALVYTALIYPGTSDLDRLKVGLSNRTEFPKLAEKLIIKNKLAALEAYAN